MSELTLKRRIFLSDIIVTAVESQSIDYWADIKDYAFDYDGKGNLVNAKAMIHESEPNVIKDKDLWRVLDHDAVEVGINDLLFGHVKMAKELTSILFWANRENDGTDIDSEIADCIVQAAMLGRLVYG